MARALKSPGTNGARPRALSGPKHRGVVKKGDTSCCCDNQFVRARDCCGSGWAWFPVSAFACDPQPGRSFAWIPACWVVGDFGRLSRDAIRAQFPDDRIVDVSASLTCSPGPIGRGCDEPWCDSCPRACCRTRPVVVGNVCCGGFENNGTCVSGQKWRATWSWSSSGYNPYGTWSLSGSGSFEYTYTLGGDGQTCGLTWTGSGTVTYDIRYNGYYGDQPRTFRGTKPVYGQSGRGIFEAGLTPEAIAELAMDNVPQNPVIDQRYDPVSFCCRAFDPNTGIETISCSGSEKDTQHERQCSGDWTCPGGTASSTFRSRPIPTGPWEIEGTSTATMTILTESGCGPPQTCAEFFSMWLAGDPAADYNGDGFVDGLDYDQYIAAHPECAGSATQSAAASRLKRMTPGSSVTASPAINCSAYMELFMAGDPRADLNGDGVVDGRDLDIYMRTCGP